MPRPRDAERVSDVLLQHNLPRELLYLALQESVAKATTAAARYLRDLCTTNAQASGLLVMAS